jgi:hypothetical protein
MRISLAFIGCRCFFCAVNEWAAETVRIADPAAQVCRPKRSGPFSQAAIALFVNYFDPVAVGVLDHVLEVAVAARARLADDRMALRPQVGLTYFSPPVPPK